MLERIRPKHLAWIAIGVAAAYRALDLTYGFPGAYVPDEELVVNSTLGMAGARSLRPLLLNYPALYQYLLLALYGAAFAIMKAAGAVSSASEFGIRFYEDPTLFYLLGRIASAVFGVGAVVLVWRIGSRLFGAWAGAAGALGLALSPVHQGQSVAAVPNSAMAFAGVLALLVIVDVFEKGRRRDYLLAGAAIALSVSFKYNTGLLVLALAVAHFLRRPRAPWKHLAFGIAVAAPLFLLFNPYWIFEFRGYLGAFLYESSHMRTGHPGHLYGPPVLWFAGRVLAEEGIVGAAILAGLLAALGRRTKGDLLLLAYALPSFLAITSLRNQGLDYCIGLYPAFAIFAGRAIAGGLGALGARWAGRAPAAVAVFLLLPALLLAGSRLRDSHLPDTRTLAREWVEENLPEGTTIAIDGMI
ncbi:MAG: glycosyltransferase family 39 protein, partial [Candidatus Eisenbacteria bacterium]